MRLPLLLLLGLLAIGFAGCTDDDDASGDDDAMADDAMMDDGNGTMAPPAPISLAVATTGTYPINPGFDGDLGATAGQLVELTFTNNDPNTLVVHDWVLEGVEGAATAAIGSGDSDTITFNAPTEAGAYAFFCSIGDHRAQGMEGTFAVA